MKRISLLRNRSDKETKVGYAELFFDLVFVLAIIMISHRLVEHLSFVGAYETIILLLSMWWVWIYTTWATNWLNPQSIPVRIMLFLAMLGGLVMAVSIPYAFEKTGLFFALAYISIQIGRTVFITYCYPKGSVHHVNFRRITIWFLVSGVFWIVGGLSGGYAQLAWWTVALLIEYAGPWFRFWLPHQGSTNTRQWDIDGAHMAERCALFIIIALGETILVMGRTLSEKGFDTEHTQAFLITFFGSVLLWWIYFNVGVERGSIKIAKSDDPGKIGRIAYTYIHVLIIAGIIFIAAADELLIAHPHDGFDVVTLLIFFGGPLMYLLGNLFFKKIMYGFYPQSHLYGIGLLVVIAFFAMNLHLMTAGLLIVAVLTVVACIENLCCVYESVVREKLYFR